MLTVKDIPESMLEQIQETFDRDPKVCWLRTQQTLMQRKGRYIEAMKLAKDIEIIYARVVQNILDDAEKATSNIHLDDTGMPEADIESLLECVVTLFMAPIPTAVPTVPNTRPATPIPEVWLFACMCPTLYCSYGVMPLPSDRALMVIKSLVSIVEFLWS